MAFCLLRLCENRLRGTKAKFVHHLMIVLLRFFNMMTPKANSMEASFCLEALTLSKQPKAVYNYYLLIVYRFVSGTIERSRLPTFERVLWRVLRGNLYMNHADIEEPFINPVSGEEVRKNVFIIFAHGEALLAKIRKVAEAMGATLYPIDANADKRNDALRDVNTRIEDLSTALYNTGHNRRIELNAVGDCVTKWQDVVRKEKLIYETLNLFNYDTRRKTLLAEGWVPTRDITRIQVALRHATVCLPLTFHIQCSYCIFRRNLGRMYLRFFTSFELTRSLRHLFAQTSLRRVFKPLWTVMVSLLIRKLTLVCLPSSHSLSCLLLCLEISVMGLSFFSLHLL